jgi:N-acetylglutamate synthase-like GNAT family acetyltransferase
MVASSNVAPRNPVNELIREASSEQDYKAFAQLIDEYVAWLRSRYEQDNWFITEVLDKQSLSSELENLSTMYGSSNGRAFLAVYDNEVRGCGAYRRLADGICEMKRVFVPMRFQGTGMGRRICSVLIASARADGFQLMRLDTGNLMKEAFTMYQSFGFKECSPYYEYPEKLMPYFVFMELPLAGAAADSR